MTTLFNVNMFAFLVASHFLADFGLQSEWMARNKNRHLDASFEPGVITWPLVMTAHAMIHGFFVYLFTGNIYFGLGEFALHWLIDWGKTEHIYGIYPDQVMHILCKVLWVTL